MGGITSSDSFDHVPANTGSWNSIRNIEQRQDSTIHTTEPMLSTGRANLDDSNRQGNRSTKAPTLFGALQSCGSQVWRFRIPGLYDDDKCADPTRFNTNEVQDDHSGLNYHFSDGSTPLTRALKSHDIAKVTDILGSPGIDVNFPEIAPPQFRECMKPPLVVAVQIGSKDLVQILLDTGANINVPDGDGLTALYHAAEQGFIETVQLLISLKSDLHCNHPGYDPLHAAVRHGNLAMVKLLVASGCPVDPVKDSSSPSLLHLALEQKNTELCLFLLHHGADGTGKGDPNHPFLSSCMFGLPEVVQYFIKAGCDVNMRGSNSTTALACAVNMFNYQSERELLLIEFSVTTHNCLSVPQKQLISTRMKLTQMLCKSKCELNVKCTTMSEHEKSVTPLYLAIQNFNLPCAMVLLQHGAAWDNMCLKALLQCHSCLTLQLPTSKCIQILIQKCLPVIINMISHKDRMLFWKSTDHHYKVPALKDCCRQVIRAQLMLHHFSDVTNQQSILTLIPYLKLPVLLKDYLSFEELSQEIYQYLNNDTDTG